MVANLREVSKTVTAGKSLTSILRLQHYDFNLGHGRYIYPNVQGNSYIFGPPLLANTPCLLFAGLIVKISSHTSDDYIEKTTQNQLTFLFQFVCDERARRRRPEIEEGQKEKQKIVMKPTTKQIQWSRWILPRDAITLH